MQAHFAHKSGGCSEESFVHFICKNWLFEKGCQFKVNGTTYEVSDIQTEQTLHTSFGDYRPDIIVDTSEGKQFFFEIKYTNKKTELYAPKWDELGNDVVEVDAREFINNKHSNDIPEFKLIYSDGECFIKSYSRTDYEDTIAKRKLEWKRQDKLNYKIQWERLDWFWEELCKYKKNDSDIEMVSLQFSRLKFNDMDFAMEIVKKMRCVDLFKTLVPIINNKFFDENSGLLIRYGIQLKQKSQRVFYISYDGYSDDYVEYKGLSYKINRNISYYSSELLEIINNCVPNEETLYLPQYEKIKSIISEGRFKKHVKCYFDILNRNITVKEKEKIIYYYHFYKEDTMHDNICWAYLEQYIAYPKREIKLENNFSQNINKELIAKKICNKINTSKNEFWSAYYNMRNNTIEIAIWDDYISIYRNITSIYIKNEDSLQQVFEKTKQKMNAIISNSTCFLPKNVFIVIKEKDDSDDE